MNGLRRLFRGENDYNFVRGWRIGLAVSGVLLVLSVASFFLRGIEQGIDFEGGTAWEVPSGDLSVGEVRDLLRPLGQAEARIQTVGGDTVRVQSTSSSPEETAAVRDALAEGAGVAPEDVAVTEVGPSWGSEISRKALRALVLFFVVIALYISWTLREWRMAVGALSAVLHDIVLSVGVYSLFGVEVTPATVIAFLTILGFSLYDTVVVFDKIRENTPKVSVAGRMTYTEMANLSMNQVLMRSINTSLTALLPVLCILVVGAWIMGATTLEEFGLALLVGLLCGAYSSIFVATPIVAILKEREPQYRLVRQRLARRAGEIAPTGRAIPRAGGPALDASPERDADQDDGDAAPVPSAAPGRASGERTLSGAAAPGPSRKGGGRPVPAGYSSSHPPRPRKKGRR
jgi:preprotein translocase subunit SecF